MLREGNIGAAKLAFDKNGFALPRYSDSVFYVCVFQVLIFEFSFMELEFYRLEFHVNFHKNRVRDTRVVTVKLSLKDLRC